MAKRAISHILLLVDGGSEPTLRASEQAIALARTAEAKLTAIAVIDTETLRNLLTFRILASQEMSDLETELETSTRQHLERVRAMAMDQKVVCEQVLVRGSYNTAVLDQQKQLGADLLVLRAFKSSQATRDLLARELQKITDEAPCTVLLAK